MAIVKSISSLRRKSHLETRLSLRDERAYAFRLLPWLALVDISFGFVDWFSVKNGNAPLFFGIRVLAVLSSRLLYLLSRGRARYGLRFFFTVAPYLFSVEYIMISQNLTLGPYFAGLSLVMVTATMLFPVPSKIVATVYFLCVAPVLAWLIAHPIGSSSDMLNMILMLIGSVLVCSVNSGQVYQDYRQKLVLAEALARDLGKREKEIRKKADQLLRRRAFESQFSPQVVSAVLHDSSSIKEMSQREVVVLVIDIENSTSKTKTLDARRYKEVVEEVFDVFSSACLKWNVTVDKFTGDGAQAFAGAPVESQDDFPRVLLACKDMIQMLGARSSLIEPLWGDRLNVRFAACEGPALVGFLGKGTLKSFTAIGETVSLTHRLCALAPPWVIAAYSWNREPGAEVGYPGFSTEMKWFRALKGFGDQNFKISLLRPDPGSSPAIDSGRCPKCGTPLTIEDGPNGLPRVSCPGCLSRDLDSAA